MDTTTATTTEPTFESLGALFAYEYRTHGADHLKAVLAGLIRDGNQRREHLEKAGCEVKALGLHQVADLVMQYAAQCPPMTDLRFCPYRAGDPGSESNIAAWIRGAERRGEKKRQECAALLHKAGVSTDWLINGETR
jgi:hypothetical protein